MSAIEKLADRYGEIGQDGPSSVLRGVRIRQATEDIGLFRSVGLAVVDLDEIRTEIDTVAEFLRQWAIPHVKDDDIYGVLFDTEKDDLVNLKASHLRAILAAVAVT